MSSTKGALIVFALCAALFIVLIYMGVGQENKPAGNSHPNLAALNGMLGPLAPKLDLKDKVFNVPPTPLRVAVPTDENHSYRKATFQLTPERCATITYDDPQGQVANLNHQSYPNQAYLIIQKSGGTLTLTRTSSLRPCAVRLE
jgi:hypothetical protein